MWRSILIGLLSVILTSCTGTFNRQKNPADYVNPLIDTKKPRWLYFSSACRPFGMVSLSPDTWVLGTWNSGYLYDTTTIRCFSHIHCWQLSGIPVMPVTGSMKGQLGFEANKSRFSHDKEVVKPGYHKVVLDDYNITAELTSTCRVGFHRYLFPGNQPGHILFDVGAELGQSARDSAAIRKSGDSELAGYAIMSPTIRRKKPCKVYFIAQFNRPFSAFGGWKKPVNDKEAEKALFRDISGLQGIECGGYVTFDNAGKKPVLVKVALSYVSEEQARMNMNAELPHWDFDRIVKESHDEWNKELGKIEIEGGTYAQRVKFYTDLFHVLLGRHIYSDHNGMYTDNTGPEPRARQIPLDSRGYPVFNMHNSDSFWGTEFNLNILWSIAYPQAMNDMAATLIEYYKNGGLIARGPSGGNYTFVMNGDQAVPLIAAAYNKGIRNFDIETAFAGCLKNAEPGGIRSHGGYEAEANKYVDYYVERGYVPEGIPGVGWHKGGCALTLYFAYQDWCLAQFAKGLGKTDIYEHYLKRSFSYRNVFDLEVGWMRPREMDGSWYKDFKPVEEKGAARGFTEGNSAMFTYYVPHNMKDLIEMIGGNEAFIAKLNKQFELAAPNRFITPHGLHARNWVDYENQPSFHMAHLFSHAGAPWLTQYWLRRLKDEVFSDITPYGGYNGDEDQGQIGGFGVITSIGLFDIQGGAAVDPYYEITSPVFDKITIHLDNRYYKGKTFVIKTINNSSDNIYIQSARLNNKTLNSFRIPHSAVANGGELEIVLSDKPSKWGVVND
ncbi:MAG TPA: glycoside hydrolase family 92 protein [Bacteroidales bacterium]|nr:glycoside hydrolase family 92 protein [Bacteroidales bacterium]